MTEKLILAIDLGTSGMKVALISVSAAAQVNIRIKCFFIVDLLHICRLCLPMPKVQGYSNLCAIRVWPGKKTNAFCKSLKNSLTVLLCQSAKPL